MRRLLAITGWLVVFASVAVAQTPVTRPVTLPATEPATVPSTAPTTGPTTAASQPATQASTQPTTQSDADFAAAEAKAEAERQAAEAREAEARAAADRRRDERVRVAQLLNTIIEAADATVSELNARGRELEELSELPKEIEAAYAIRSAEIDARVAENAGLVAGVPTLETLSQQRAALEDDLKQIDIWARDLTDRFNQIQTNRDKLKPLENSWTQRRRELVTEVQASTRPTTRASTRATSRATAEDLAPLITRTDEILKQISDQTERARVERRRIHPQFQLAIYATRLKVSDALGDIIRAQRDARDRLLKQDSPPLWNSLLHPMSQGDVTAQGRNTFNSQWAGVTNYVPRNARAFLMHFTGVAILAGTLMWLRFRTRQWTAGDPTLLAATRVFETPIATAITASMILTPWIYAGAPRLFWGVIGTGALLPTIMVLRPLIERSLRPLLYGLAVAIFVNLLLSIVQSLPLVYRALQLGQMGGATVFFLWFLRTRHGKGDDATPPLRKPVIIGARIGLAITVFASLCNIFGYVSLARLTGNALLTSCYLGVLLDTSVHVGNALLLGLSHVQPISGLGMVQRHRPLLLRRLHWLLCLIAIGLWGYFTLESLTIRQPVFEAAERIWYWPQGRDIRSTAIKAPEAADADAGGATSAGPTTAPAADKNAVTGTITVTGTGSGTVTVTGTGKGQGTVTGGAAKPAEPADPAATLTTSSDDPRALLTVGGVILFVVSIVSSIYVARFIAFLLDEDVYPRLNLARGMPYAISTLLRYAILAIGFSMAIVNLGYGDPTKLTILVSAFSIGLGFGLQNIVNNFVSGLILLFERPVQVGDVIDIGGVTGVVSRIGIRASVIRTPLAAEIIIPNGSLISGQVINWTLSNRQRGVELSITIESGVEPKKFIQLLCSTAAGLPLVAAYPAPQAYFADFTGGGMKFEVRAWTNRFEDWTQVRSELAVAINAMLVKEQIKLK